MLTTLSRLQAVCEEAQAAATPHRIHYFEAIRRDAVDRDPVVLGVMILEEHTDTGYDGVLHRWRFRVDGKNGKTITFEADVLPDAICEYDLSRKHVHDSSSLACQCHGLDQAPGGRRSRFTPYCARGITNRAHRRRHVEGGRAVRGAE